MATTTTNLGLTKQADNEYFDINVQNDNLDKIDAAVDALGDTVTTYHADNSKQIPHLGTTTNSGDAYSITTTETINTNQKFTIKFNANSTTAPTLKINTGTACAIKKANGTNAKLYASVYTLFWDGSAFILLGEGGDYGTATAAEVLNGYTVGTASGVVPGTLSLTGTALASDVVSGKTFYNTDAKTKVTGTAPVYSYTASDTVLISDTTAYPATTGMTKLSKTFTVTAKTSGTIRLKFIYSIWSSANIGYIQIYKNGIPYGSQITQTWDTAGSNIIQSYSYDIACNAGDTIAIYGAISTAGGDAGVKSISICGTVTLPGILA